MLAERIAQWQRGHAELAGMVGSVLQAGTFALIAVTTGPGSFTGLRAALALAQGLALGADIKVVGVTVAEALAEAWAPTDDRALWVAIDNRRGRVFLHRDGAVATVEIAAIAPPTRPIALAGDAAIAVAAHLAARGHNVMLTDGRTPQPRDIAAVGRQRAMGLRPPIPLLPFYVDSPEAHVPALRPAPRE